MIVKENLGLNYDQPIEIAEGIYWVGFLDQEHNLNCNPYLIVEGDEAVIVDAGSRTDFSTVMMKIMQTGVNPAQIKELIYQHYDPDLCGSIPDFEEIIDNDNLSIISHKYNNYYIRYYGGALARKCIEKDLNFEWEFSTGRKLKFILTPYAHTAGSFMTFDEQTETLFTSDLFGSYYRELKWELFLELGPKCYSCNFHQDCFYDKVECPILKIKSFHKDMIPTKKALDYALNEINNLSVKRIAPQHGSIIADKKSINYVINELNKMDNIGIDQFFAGGSDE